jgi:hypothetical protein
MKVTSLLFLMIGGAALASGTAYPDPSGPASQQTSRESAANTVSDRPQDAEHPTLTAGGKRQKDGIPSDERQDLRHVSGKNHPRSPATRVKDRPKQLPNSRVRFPSGNATTFHQLGSDKSGGTAKGGLIQHEVVNSALPVRPANVIRPTAPLLNSVRHHGANPAVIGGSANSNGRSTGAINGTGVHRRP